MQNLFRSRTFNLLVVVLVATTLGVLVSSILNALDLPYWKLGCLIC